VPAPALLPRLSASHTATPGRWTSPTCVQNETASATATAPELAERRQLALRCRVDLDPVRRLRSRVGPMAWEAPRIWGVPGDDLEDDPDAGLGWVEESVEGEQAVADALQRLREGLVRFQGEAPPAREIHAATITLRANLASEEYPFPRLARAFACSGGTPGEDIELLIRAVAATVAPLRESCEVDPGVACAEAETEAQDSDQQDEDAEDDLPLDMDTEELDLEDWLALATAVVSEGSGAWLDPERLVQAAGLDPGSDDGWIKEGALVRALSLWEDLGMLDGGRVTQVGRWVLPRALARAWEGDFDQAGG
jgi:hypothetical protein